MRTSRPLLLLLAALGCALDVFVGVAVGPLQLSASLPVEAVPEALRAPDGTLLPRACDPQQPCPEASSTEVSVRCVQGACSLAPLTLRSTAGDLDLEDQGTFRDYSGALRGLTLERARVTLAGFQAGNAVGPLSLWWVREGATPGEGEARLGEFPRLAITEAAPSTELALNAEGVRALEAVVLSGTRKLRLRVEGPVEVGASALPASQVTLSLRLSFVLASSL